MKNKLRILSLFICVNVLFSRATASHPSKLVGYYAAAMSGTGPKPDYIEETKDCSNFIMVGTSNVDDYLFKIEKARNFGLSAILMVQNVFFMPGTAMLYPDYEKRFVNFMAALKPVESSIIGFYPLDEPNGFNSQLRSGRVDAYELYLEQEKINALIHRLYPDKITMTIFSPGETNENLLVPPHTDYIGFDCYWSFGPVCGVESLAAKYQVLISKKAPSQKLVAVVDSYINRRPSDADQFDIVRRIGWWEDFIADKPEFSAVVPFIYQSEPRGGDPRYGAESMPIVKQKIEFYMRSQL